MKLKGYGLLVAGICLGLYATGFKIRPSAPKPPNFFVIDTVAKNVIVPWEILFLPDQTMLFTERAGRVRIYRHNRLIEKPALTVSDVETTKKMGLLGLCIHPDFQKNRLIYLAYNYLSGTTPLLRVVRYRFENDVFVSPKTIIEGILANMNHTGCRLKFGPDRKLYVTTGDADHAMQAQDLKSLTGKILRLNDDGSIPADNPFMSNDTARKEIWSYGHRNPQGLAFQPGTGTLFESEHGPTGGDEVNRIEKGKNYGWPRVHHRDVLAGTEPPLLEYTPSVGPAEAVFYTGTAFPNLKGNLLVATMRGESILRIQVEGDRLVAQERLFRNQFGRIRALAVGPDGAIYLSTSQNDPPEGKPRPGDDLILRIRPATHGNELQAFSATIKNEPTTTDGFVATTTPEGQYQQLCASCHGAALEGTDRAKSLRTLKNGSTRNDLIRIIQRGLTDKGMPAWEGALSPTDIEKMADFILSKTGKK
ncbi:PQQ-dependent sugar dehydrogenase [Larkinella rosea]|uniref:PQQ-dependent sugar dehydrogenase n=1 Tax=Larkinella rosea TaxID=2025312 RepID=A0A3P1BNX4_9BACT|nr:PQQ-dependent sugar dehydrogenase [Larkinella rosea]RRB02769.1 PQQ-dependent sugar dehydrogenase [Larkinella rosea]